MNKKTSLYDQIVDVAADYLGPAAGRFVDRQITSNLQKDPKNIHVNDLEKLTNWIRLSIHMLTSDEDLVEEFIERLNKLPRKAEQEKKKSDPAYNNMGTL